MTTHIPNKGESAGGGGRYGVYPPLVERTGCPLGQEKFVEALEVLLDRKFKRQKPGPKKKAKLGVPRIPRKF